LLHFAAQVPNAIIEIIAGGHCSAKQSDDSGVTSATLVRPFFAGRDDGSWGPYTAIKNDNRVLNQFNI
jgi:hypothetical protein